MPRVSYKTDATGRFEIRGLQNRPYRLQVMHNAAAQRIVTEEQMPGAWVDIRLAPVAARHVSGVVRDAVTHKPLANIRVEASYLWNQSVTIASAVTDASGRYRLPPLRVTSHVSVSFHAPGYRPILRGIDDFAKNGDVTMSRSTWLRIQGFHALASNKKSARRMAKLELATHDKFEKTISLLQILAGPEINTVTTRVNVAPDSIWLSSMRVRSLVLLHEKEVVGRATCSFEAGKTFTVTPASFPELEAFLRLD